MFLLKYSQWGINHLFQVFLSLSSKLLFFWAVVCISSVTNLAQIKQRLYKILVVSNRTLWHTITTWTVRDHLCLLPQNLHVCLLHFSFSLQASFFHIAERVFTNNSTSLHSMVPMIRLKNSSQREKKKVPEKLYVQYSVQTQLL